MAAAQLSTIEPQLIPGGLVSKIAMGAGVPPDPHHIWGWGSAQLNQPDLTLKFGMGGLGDIPNPLNGFMSTFHTALLRAHKPRLLNHK